MEGNMTALYKNADSASQIIFRTTADNYRSRLHGYESSSIRAFTRMVLDSELYLVSRILSTTAYPCNFLHNTQYYN